MANQRPAQIARLLPRFIRAGEAYGYLGMCRDEFNKTVRPHVREFPIGKQGVGFDRLELEACALAPYISSKLEPITGKPVTNRTVNIALQRVIRVLNLCARKWRDDERRPWLDVVPMISLLGEKTNCRKPYPLSWEEQSILFAELPAHLQTMALFKVNTGCREQEVCKLQWDWEIAVPELDTTVFLIPAGFGGRSERSGVKNRDERLVILNTVAKSVIEKQRGQHKLYVFPFGKPDGDGD